MRGCVGVWIGFGIVSLLVIALLSYMRILAKKTYIDHKTLEDPHFPASFENVNLFFISDIHKRLIEEEWIKSINETIDIVIIGGDLVEKGVPLERTKQNILTLKQLNAPIYFVWGNNDYEVDYHQLDAMLLELDVKILANAAANFETEAGDSLSVIGLDCLQNRPIRVDHAFQEATGSYKILVTHDPRGIRKLDQGELEKVNLVLSGHTHGGQIRLFGFGIYKRGGWSFIDKRHMLISEGFGTTGLHLRLGTRAESHIISIKPV